MLRKIIIGLLGVALLVLAGCTAPTLAAPCTVTPSKQAAEQLLLRAQQAYAPGRPLVLTATNQEATSLLRQYMEQLQASDPSSTIPIENPVICFDTGKAHLFGNLRLDKDNAVTALITLSASITDGKPEIKVQQIQLGPVPVPTQLASELTKTLNSLAMENLAKLNLTEIRLTPGEAMISGRPQN